MSKVVDGFKLFVGLAAIGGVLTGEVVRRFERDAARDIATRLQGPGVTVRLKTVPQGPFGLLQGDIRRGTIEATHFEASQLPLFTEPARPQNGRLRELRLSLVDFRLAGLHIDRLEATIPNCRYDLNLAKREHKVRLSRSGEGTGDVHVRQADLEAFVLKKYHEIKSVAMNLSGGYAEIDGVGEFLLVRTRFHVVASLVAVDKRKLALAKAIVYFDGMPASTEASQALLKALNPVVDLDADLKLHGAIDLERVTLDHGELIATGKTRIPIENDMPG